MSCLLNCIAAGDTIEKIKSSEIVDPDKDKLGFEFGTWTFPPYYNLFELIGNIKDKSMHNHKFTPTERKKILTWLDRIIKNWKPTTLKTSKKQMNAIIEKLPVGHPNCTACTKDENGKVVSHNPFHQHTKALIEGNHPNPLMLGDVKWYEKLAKIFKQEQVQIIAR